MIQYQTSGMTCKSCVLHITRAIEAIDSKAKVAVDLTSQQVQVESGVSPETIASAIESEGYPVSGFTELSGSVS